MQLPFQHHVDFVVVQGPREECVLPLHKTGGHAAAVVSGHKISQAHAMRLCAVETTKLDATAINHFDAAFAGHRFEARLHCALLQRRSEEHTSELQSRFDLVCRLLLEKKNA